MRSATALLAFTAAGVLVAALAQTAHATQPTLFFSPGDTGQDPGALPVPLAPNGTRTLYLYLKPGTVTSSGGCNASTCGGSGVGDETCGVNFEIRVNGDLELTSFSSPFGQMSSKLEDLDGNTLEDIARVAIVTTNPPICAVPSTKVGTLTLTAGPAGGTVSLAKLQTADADLELKTGGTRDLALVPEPGAGLQLAAGAMALAGLARRRARRGIARARRGGAR